MNKKVRTEEEDKAAALRHAAWLIRKRTAKEVNAIKALSGSSKEQVAAYQSIKKEFSHYYRHIPCDGIDIYRILLAFEITDPCIQHAIKKLLCMGKRGSKSPAQDIHEAMACLERWNEMRAEEETRPENVMK